MYKIIYFLRDILERVPLLAYLVQVSIIVLGILVLLPSFIDIVYLFSNEDLFVEVSGTITQSTQMLTRSLLRYTKYEYLLENGTKKERSFAQLFVVSKYSAGMRIPLKVLISNTEISLPKEIGTGYLLAIIYRSLIGILCISISIFTIISNTRSRRKKH